MIQVPANRVTVTMEVLVPGMIRTWRGHHSQTAGHQDLVEPKSSS
jgi:hypothetical protein